MSDQEMPEAWQLRAEEQEFEERVKYHAMLQTSNEERVARLGTTGLFADPANMQAFMVSQIKLRLDHLTDYLLPSEVRNGDEVELSATRVNYEIAFEQTLALMLDALMDEATQRRLVVPK